MMHSFSTLPKEYIYNVTNFLATILDFTTFSAQHHSTDWLFVLLDT